MNQEALGALGADMCLLNTKKESRLFFKVVRVEDVVKTKAVGRHTELFRADGIAS